VQASGAGKGERRRGSAQLNRGRRNRETRRDRRRRRGRS
jgi:hypothetical protein